MPSNNILIISGEVSGDLHAAPVVFELKKLKSELAFWGTGGHQMSETGVELLAHIDDLAVMGFSDIPKMLPRLSRLRKTILKQVASRKTQLVILVDYPGFNLNLAKVLKGIDNPPKILYYIAPQVWAWRSGRIRKMSRVVDRLAVVFPFEVELFRAEGIKVDFVGHPLLDELGDYLTPTVNHGGMTTNPISAVSPPRLTAVSDKPLLALLPGSRVQEIKRHLPIMVNAALRLRETIPNLKAAIGCAPNLDKRLYEDIIGDSSWIELHNDSRDLLLEADAAAVCSGTATLETALMGTPQVVVYHTSTLNYLIAKTFVHLKNIALVNVVAGKRIVPELIQYDLTPQNLTRELKELLSDKQKQVEMINAYKDVTIRLGTGNAAKNVAKIAFDMLE
ncbi:MAG: lipid-A-disaccharide synthase [Candidatus Hatepunaea meridiana]|nr:lipid-A-disaccharide synthase [Candidatus Hatepunaea meridiana]